MRSTFITKIKDVEYEITGEVGSKGEVGTVQIFWGDKDVTELVFKIDQSIYLRAMEILSESYTDAMEAFYEWRWESANDR